MQREHRRYRLLSQHRVDPELADPWAPEIVLAEQPLIDGAEHAVERTVSTRSPR